MPEIRISLHNKESLSSYSFAALHVNAIDRIATGVSEVFGPFLILLLWDLMLGLAVNQILSASTDVSLGSYSRKSTIEIGKTYR